MAEAARSRPHFQFQLAGSHSERSARNQIFSGLCPDISRLVPPDPGFPVSIVRGHWRDLPEHYGKHGTISRYFRRLTHVGFWENLLLALAAAPKGHPLRRLEGYICRTARRAIRLRGLRIIVLARRLGLYRALPAPPCLMPDPDLSEFVRRQPLPFVIPRSRRLREGAIEYIRTLKRLLAAAAGRRRIPAVFKRIWI